MKIALKILFILITYLFASIPWGFLFGKMKGIDIREHGSKNIGTTNTGRVLGRKYAIITYLLDMFKGFIFVFLFRFDIIPGFQEYMVLSPALYGMIAILGHSFPVYLKFKGGKAVATGSGFILGFCPWLFGIGFVSFLVVLLITRYVSLSSLIAAAAIFIGALILTIFKTDPIFNLPVDYYFLIFVTLSVAIIFIKHRGNIKRLQEKTENQVDL